MIARYSQLPDIVTGYPLEGKDSWFSIIVPIARTNLCQNPSFETNATGWTAYFSASLARSSAQQYHGAYSLAVTPTAALTDGADYATLTLTANITYAISCKFLGVQGRSYSIIVRSLGPAVVLITSTFTATGRWQWVWLYYTEATGGSRELIIAKNNHASTAAFYIDGVQVEALGSLAETVSTYIDGDQQGLVPNQQPPAYLWTGTPHASTSSRSGLTRAGGMVYPLNYYNFLLTAIIGLGLATPQNIKTEYARLDGAFDDYTRKGTRQFTLLGRLSGLSSDALDAFRSDLGAALDRDRVGLDQRLLLRYQKIDRNGNVRSIAGIIPAKYAGGLGGNTDNLVAEHLPLSFEQYAPFIQAEQETGAALAVQTGPSANTILYRTSGGLWQALGSGAASGSVIALARGLDGVIYAGGDFPAMGGVANTNSIAKWDPVAGAWSAMGTGVSGGAGVDAIAVGADGSVYVSGSFTAMSGVANTSRIAKWDPVALSWSALSTGANGEVRALAVAPNGDLYATGDFLLMAGVANTVRIAKWNGAAWSALSTGLDAGGYALAFDKAGNLFVGGQFGVAGGVTAPRVAKWDGSAFTALTATATGTVDALAFGLNGLLYVAGTFTTIAGVSNTSRIAQYNGTAFQPLGVGVSNTVNALAVDAAGILHVGGQFATAGGITLPDSFARWNRATWLVEDINLPGSAIVQAILPLPDGSQYIGFTTTGTAAAPGLTTATNNGTAKTYPTLKITGPTSGTSRIYQIINYTTNRSVFFNLTLTVGETVTMVFQPDNLSFVSTFQGDVANTILPGSSEADFFLQPGANAISFFAADSTVVAAMWWKPAYASLDGLTR